MSHLPRPYRSAPLPPAHVVIPAVAELLHRATLDSVRRQWPQVEVCLIRREDRLGYARLLAEWWDEPSDLVVVEQDMVVPPGSIRQLLCCINPWCGHAYPYEDQVLEQGLGLTRFKHELKLRWPELMRSGLGHSTGTEGLSGYHSCDARIARHMRMNRIRWHRHWPDAQHLHDYRVAIHPSQLEAPQGFPSSRDLP